MGSAGLKYWTLVLGNNGLGKTTLLRAIAIGIGDKDHASALLRDSPGNWITKDADESIGNIILDLIDGPSGRNVVNIKTEIKMNGDSETISNQIVKGAATELLRKNVFICGYGAGRNIAQTQSYSTYRPLDSVYTLFQYEQPLQNPELTLRRLQSEHGSLHDVLLSIDQILLLEPGSTQLNKTGITITGPWGQNMSLEALGDGYKGTISWVVDFLGWALFYNNRPVALSDISGVIIIDELDQHLHPIWQRRIIKNLQEQFPHVQFIATTHTPMLAIGTTDLRDKDVQIVVLKREDNYVKAESD